MALEQQTLGLLHYLKKESIYSKRSLDILAMSKAVDIKSYSSFATVIDGCIKHESFQYLLFIVSAPNKKFAPMFKLN